MCLEFVDSEVRSYIAFFFKLSPSFLFNFQYTSNTHLSQEYLNTK